MADVTLVVQSNFMSLFWGTSTHHRKVGQEDCVGTSGVVYQSNQKGLLYKLKTHWKY